MKNNCLVFSLIVLCLLPFVSAAQTEGYTAVTNIDLLKQKLTQQASNTLSIESDFVQEKHLWMLEEVLLSKGRFLFKKENSVRWQYITPVEYLILIHKNKFSIVSNGKVNEFSTDSNPMFKQINKMIVASIKGDFIDNTDFNSDFYENNIDYLAILKPQIDDVKSMLSAIEIYFNKQDMQVSKVVFREPGDDFTIITFVDKKVNVEIPEKEFLITE